MARTQGSRSSDTGPRVRAAALKLFARHGYAAVSMRQIAQEVGVQAGALYSYTPDKQALLFSLMKHHMEELLDARAARDGKDPLERLEAFVRFHIRHHAARPDEVFIAYMELRNLEPAHFTIIEDMRRQYEQELEAILRDGAETGVMEVADAKIASLALIAMLTGVNTWFREGGRLSLAEIEEIYLGMVRRAVGV